VEEGYWDVQEWMNASIACRRGKAMKPNQNRECQESQSEMRPNKEARADQEKVCRYHERAKSAIRETHARLPVPSHCAPIHLPRPHLSLWPWRGTAHQG
jgi:hypothetical protein